MNGVHLSAHLTDEQFADCLTALTVEPGIQAHVAQCDACRLELGVFLASMEDFSSGALAWSRAQAAPRALPVDATHALAPPLRWALACAAMLAVAAPVALHYEPSAASAKMRMSAAEIGDSPAQIAQDNRLLESVDLALDEADPSPWQEYHLDDPQKSSNTRTRTE